jgi:DNA-binding response OmpR family regulator
MFNILEQFEARKGTKPDLILMDLNMPDVSGFEGLEQLKANEKYAAIPVVILSGQSCKDSISRGIQLGAAAHLLKPYSILSLVKTIEDIFNPFANAEAYDEDEEEGDDGRPCILAVDDAPTMLRAIHTVLRDEYKVYTLSKPEKLKSYLQNVKPDLFLLDCNMPVMNGFELFSAIRELPEHKETPIIFLTAEGTVDNLTAAMHLGASDFVVKPFEVKSLREKIETYIKRDIVDMKDDNLIEDDLST